MSAADPAVTFIVPCYKLAHLLGECVRSILAQTYTDFEVLIMDDCSPDNTPEVAASFEDPRVKHVRNQPNLGHLRNYNKGIGLARGRYIWLISADDCLRSNSALQTYVRLMEQYPSAGFAFCPAVALRTQGEAEVLPYTVRGQHDRLFRGQNFLAEILRSGGIASPSVFARTECYRTAGMFPLDLPHQGDMYMWCLWALQFDVAYAADPLVAYRLHDESMMSNFKRDEPAAILHDEFAVRARLASIFRKNRQEALLAICREWMAQRYTAYVVQRMYGSKDVLACFTADQIGNSLRQHVADDQELMTISARHHAMLGDEHYWHKNYPAALEAYRTAIRQKWRGLALFLKYFLLRFGSAGVVLRDSFFALRQKVDLIR